MTGTVILILVCCCFFQAGPGFLLVQGWWFVVINSLVVASHSGETGGESFLDFSGRDFMYTTPGAFSLRCLRYHFAPLSSGYATSFISSATIKCHLRELRESLTCEDAALSLDSGGHMLESAYLISPSQPYGSHLCSVIMRSHNYPRRSVISSHPYLLRNLFYHHCKNTTTDPQADPKYFSSSSSV